MNNPHYCPHINLPKEPHTPGQTKRPKNLFKNFWQPVAEFTAETWETTTPYLLGIDLYNNSYYWEAHEVWEEIWHTCKKTPQGNLLKSLITLSGARLKVKMNQPDQSLRMAKRALKIAKEIPTTDSDIFFGLNLKKYSEDLVAFISNFSKTKKSSFYLKLHRPFNNSFNPSL